MRAGDYIHEQMIPINNPYVSEYQNHLISIVNDQSLSKDQRMLANHKLKLVQSLALIYEQDIGEDVLFWNEAGIPLLPEDVDQLVADMQRYKLNVIKGGKQ